MLKKELLKLRKAVEVSHINWLKKGNKVCSYGCNHCGKMINTKRPTKDMVSEKGYWDSLTICVECGKANYIRVYPSGKTKSVIFP